MDHAWMKNLFACRLQPPLLVVAEYWDKKRKKKKDDSVDVIGANMSPFTFKKKNYGLP